MVTLRSDFFRQTKRKPANDSWRVGLKLYMRGACIGDIAQSKETGLFDVMVVNAKDTLSMSEFATFREADVFAWVHATSST